MKKESDIDTRDATSKIKSVYHMVKNMLLTHFIQHLQVWNIAYQLAEDKRFCLWTGSTSLHLSIWWVMLAHFVHTPDKWTSTRTSSLYMEPVFLLKWVQKVFGLNNILLDQPNACTVLSWSSLEKCKEVFWSQHSVTMVRVVMPHCHTTQRIYTWWCSLGWYSAYIPYWTLHSHSLACASCPGSLNLCWPFKYNKLLNFGCCERCCCRFFLQWFYVFLLLCYAPAHIICRIIHYCNPVVLWDALSSRNICLCT